MGSGEAEWGGVGGTVGDTEFLGVGLLRRVCVQLMRFFVRPLFGSPAEPGDDVPLEGAGKTGLAIPLTYLR